MRTLAPWRTALTVGLVISALNVVILTLGRALGTDFVVQPAGSAATTEIGIGMVVAASVGPALLGGVALWLAARRGNRSWRAVGWLGLAVGLLTVPAPFTAQASTQTTLVLASMHVVAGVAWVIAVRRQALPEAATDPDRSQQRTGVSHA
ncbi:DUF6069 family protein [Ornithinimicrobium cavernae]|uniref:DUF6069 family protein n=1 Tax=Ornithinimicrobium cavernae TaxID=2666047 RepID=UPI000D68D27E|nr:DUF6069 family protein [Ornithinimicrobium cavernae]